MTDQYLAVFDWNSTLFDDFPATFEATNECLKFFDVPPVTKEELQEKFTFPLIHFYEKAGVKVDEYLQYTQELSDIFHTRYNMLKHDCGLMKGAIKALDFCQSHNMHCIVLSNYNHDPLVEDVQRLGIAPYFETISGNENPEAITSGTNKLERLQDYMHTHGFKPQQTFIVGDSHEEPQLAHQLNILGISIAGGLLSAARLEKYKKDAVIKTLDEIPAILQREWGLSDMGKTAKTIA